MWKSDLRPLFYIVGEDHRSPRGQMHNGIDVATGQVAKIFFEYGAGDNGWERVS